VFFMLAAFGTSALAALQAVGPANPVDLFPTWYQDTSGLAVEQCLDPSATTGGIPYCTLLAAPNYIADSTPVFPTAASVGNYPLEVFYWVADTSVTVGTGLVKLRFALEQTFALGVQTPGQQITFLIINMSKVASGLPASQTFTVNHPYGSFTFQSDASGASVRGPSGQTFRVRDDATPIPLVFNTLLAAPTTHIGPFLRPSASQGGAPSAPIVVGPGKSYLANPATLTFVTGSPLGAARNNITITWPGGSVTQDQFFIQGKIAPPPGTPITVTSATYSSSATGGQVSVFATSLPTATLNVSGTVFPTTPMLHDALNPGNFFATIPIALPATLPGVPALVSVVAAQDAGLNPPVPPTTHVLVDGVTVSVANYNPTSSILTIKAASTDTVVPVPTLTVPTLAPPTAPPLLPAAGPALDATGLLNVTGLAIPPASITVASSNGGSATVPVTLGALPLPVAVADTATTVAVTPVTINVLANDTPLASIVPSSVAIVPGLTVGGTAVPNLVTGAVTFTPALGFTGPGSFSYTVTDNLAQVSLPATVSVTVNPATAAIPPVAVNDAATTVVGTAVTIPVLANDTITLPAVIDPASIVIGTALGGTAVPNPLTGTVTFTPSLGFTGAASFTYTVKNTLGLLSNSATVAVTVTANIAPAVTVADVANTLVNVPRIISVLANDTGAINPATVAIVPLSGPAFGAAVVNLDGTITFASATPGTATFQYTVKNTAGVASAPALVTVSVASVIADAVTILKAQCTNASTTKQWVVEGNTTNVSPVSKIVTLYVGNSLAGQILGTVATNPADGRWKFQLPGNVGNVGPDATKTISAKLPSGASRLAFPVAVTP